MSGVGEMAGLREGVKEVELAGDLVLGKGKGKGIG